MFARALCRQGAVFRLLARTPRGAVWRPMCQRRDEDVSEEEEKGPVLAPRLEECMVQCNPDTLQNGRHSVAAMYGAEKDELAPPPLVTELPECPGGPGLRQEGPGDDTHLMYEPRAFQRSRPEYAALSYDPARRATPISTSDAALLLNKVSVLRGSLGPQDVPGYLGELSRLPPEQLPWVRDHLCVTILLRYVEENVRLFSDGQLLEALGALVSLGLPGAHGLQAGLEAELGRRAGGLRPQQLLLVADLCRCLRWPVPTFLQQLHSSAAGWSWAELGPAELVQLLYVVGEGRRCPQNLLLTLEEQLLRHLDRLTAEEVGVVCLGLFKSRSSLSGAALLRLMDRACALLPAISDFGLVNVLKLLRFSYLDHRGLLRALAREVPRRAAGMGVQALMHMALACSALHYRDDAVLQALADRLLAVPLQCRSKDAAKLLWAFGTVRFPPCRAPRLYPRLTRAMRQQRDEFGRFPEHLLTGLMGLAFAQIFPPDLLALALCPQFVSLASSRRLELKRDLFTLDASVGLEVPDWAGPRLDRALVEEVRAQLWSFALKDVCLKPEVLEAEGLLRELLGGAAFVRKHMILPHTRSIDLEVRLDRAGSPVPLCSEAGLPGLRTESVSPVPRPRQKGRVGVAITEDLLTQLTHIKRPVNDPAKRPDSHPAHTAAPAAAGLDLAEAPLGALRTPGPSPPCPTEGVQRLAVQVSNRNQFCYQSHQLLGLHALKRRQLALSGYRVVELHYWEWFPLLKRSHADRLAYLHSKIFGDLD